MPPPRRVVLLMIEPPLPFGDAAGRWFHVLYRGLVDNGHAVTAFATCGKPRDAEAARDLFPQPHFDLRLFPEHVRPGIASKWNALRRPFSYVFSPELRAEFDREIAKGCDVVHLEQVWSGWTALKHAHKSVLNVHYLFAIDQRGVVGGPPGERLRRDLALRAERRLLRAFPVVTTLTDRLSALTRSIHPGADVTTIPLGMDASLYPFPPPATDHPPTVALIGSFHWRPTRSAGERLLRDLWPAIKARVPSARLHLVGRDARAAMGPLAVGDDIQIFENVPEIAPYFQSADVMLYAPARGSGMKVKVLEAFAFGTPVVTTSDGIEGIPAVDGVHAGVAETNEGLIDRAVALLLDRGRVDAMRRAGRELLETHCGPRTTVAAVEAVHERVAAGKIKHR